MYIAIQPTRFARMKCCQDTVVITYLCCCLNGSCNVKIMLSQPEETVVKYYYFPLQQAEFPAANTVITISNRFCALSANVEETLIKLFSSIISSGIAHNIRRMLNAPQCSLRHVALRAFNFTKMPSLLCYQNIKTHAS